MKANKIRYKTNKATEHELFLHLTECGDTFIPPLAKRVNIKEYAQKIHEKSVTFEAWDGVFLIGFIAAYFNDTTNSSAYITNVSVARNFAGAGIASKLLNMCIEYARNNNFTELTLEVYKNNNPAVRLYNKFGFKNIEIKDDAIIMKRQN